MFRVRRRGISPSCVYESKNRKEMQFQLSPRVVIKRCCSDTSRYTEYKLTTHRCGPCLLGDVFFGRCCFLLPLFKRDADDPLAKAPSLVQLSPEEAFWETPGEEEVAGLATVIVADGEFEEDDWEQVVVTIGLGLEDVEVVTMGDIVLHEEEEPPPLLTICESVPFPVVVVSSLENTPGIIYRKGFRRTCRLRNSILIKLWMYNLSPFPISLAYSSARKICNFA